MGYAVYREKGRDDRMRILVVEDERLLGEQIARGLREEMHVVDLVTDGQTALDYAALALYDAIILDVTLPLRDGLSVCREIRQQGIQSAILMLTARQSVDDRVAGLDAGADDYLTKPFAFAELLARVRALTRREGSVRVGPLEVGELSLDAVTHRVQRGAEIIHLTAREYTILELFMRHVGQTLSREQIAAAAWDMDADHASNVVDVFVRNLRRKIDDPVSADQKMLHTVRGVGYVLRPASPDNAAETRGG